MTSPILSIIVAIDEKRGIGKGNMIPWHIKKDLVHLKDLTENKTVILGENTFKSMSTYYDISGKDMPGALYIVLTLDKLLTSLRKNVCFVSTLDGALTKAKKRGENEIFIIGGASIFRQTISIVNKIYLTLVKGTYDCDTFFPDYSDFKELSSIEMNDDKYRFEFKILERS